MILQDRIIAFVTASKGLVSLEKLVDKAKSAGFSEGEVLAVLSNLGKKLKSTVRGDQVYYQVAPEPKTPIDHLMWVTANYPWPGVNGVPEFVMPFPEIDYSHLYLKTKEERDAYLAEAKGMPIHLLKKKHYAK